MVCQKILNKNIQNIKFSDYLMLKKNILSQDLEKKRKKEKKSGGGGDWRFSFPLHYVIKNFFSNKMYCRLAQCHRQDVKQIQEKFDLSPETNQAPFMR